MAILVGETYVREASYAKAKVHVEASKANTSGEVLKELKQQFKDLNIGIGTVGRSPSYSSGLNNVTIAPNILEEMAADPEKRIEYEALLDGVQELVKNELNAPRPGGGKIGYHEFFINSDGELGGMSMSQSGGSGSNSGPVAAKLPRDDKESWMDRIMKSIEEKREKEKEAAQRLAERKARGARLVVKDGRLDVTI